MVSITLCPAVHILGSQNVYSRAEGIADHYWPRAILFSSASHGRPPQACFSLSFPLHEINYVTITFIFDTLNFSTWTNNTIFHPSLLGSGPEGDDVL